MKIALVLATAALALPTAAQPAKPPPTYLVSLQGTVGTTSSFENEGVSEGGACHFHTVWRGDDDLTYASDRPVAVRVGPNGANVTIRVRYRLVMAGTRDVTSLTGNCPNGAPVFNGTGCGTYRGTFPVRMRIGAHGLTIAGGGTFEPPGPCPGDHGLGIPLSRAKINLATVIKRQRSTVTGALALDIPPGNSVQIESDFRARFVRK